MKKSILFLVLLISFFLIPSIVHAELQGDYYDNIDFTNLKITRTDSTINFDWGTGSPDASIGVDTFSVRWQGYVKADYSETYTFYVTSDDGSRVWIDNQLVIDSWVDQWVGEYPNTGSIALTAGWHTIKYEYYENAGNAVAKLYYSSPSITEQIIPSDHLETTTATCDSTCKSQGYTTGSCEAGTSSPTGMLHVCGTSLCDENNNVVRLKCTQVTWNEWYKQQGSLSASPSPDKSWFSLDDVNRMKQAGANCLEIQGIMLYDLTNPDGSVNNNYLTNWVDVWVNWCTQNKMYCLLTAYNTEAATRGSWVNPQWLYTKGGYPTPASEQDWVNIISDFFDVTKAQQNTARAIFTNMWATIANRYKNNPYVMYGLMNEPFNFVVNIGYPHTSDDTLSRGYSSFFGSVVDAIRNTGSTQIVSIDWPFLSTTYDLTGKNITNIMWESHHYVEPSRPYSQWQTDVQTFYNKFVTGFGRPFYVGEYGFDPPTAIRNYSDWRTILQNMVTYLDSKQLAGRSFFEWGETYGEYFNAGEPVSDWTTDESNYIIQTVLGGSTTTTTGTCQSGESSIGQDSCSSNNLCCCKSDLIGYWKFDEGSGTTAKDSSPFHNDATLINSPTWVTGKSGSALQFNGSNQYVTANNVPINTSAGANNTVAFWMYWTGTKSQIPFSWNPATNAYDLWLSDTDNFGFNTYGNDVYGISGATSLLANKWSHIAAIFPNGYPTYEPSLYINGVKQTLSLLQGSMNTESATPTLFIGENGPGSNYRFGGIIDEVKVFNRALTATEILNEYNGGVQSCSDGTAYNSCSSNQPLYCSSGTLINGCGSPYNCGCPSSQSCQSDGSCQTISGSSLMLHQYTFYNWQLTAQQFASSTAMAQFPTWDSQANAMIASVHTLNPSFMGLYYRDASRYSSYYSGQYEPQNMATLQSFCLKDSTGAYVHATGDSTWMYLDIGNPAFQQWYANYVANAIKTYGYDGVFMDDGFGQTFWEIYYDSMSAPPVNPRTGSTTWTDAEIQSYLISFYTKVRAAIGPNKLIIANGLYTGSRWFNNKAGYENVFSNSPIDGIMGEGWWKSSGTTDWYPESSNNPSWKDGVDAMIELETLYPNKYFVPVCYDYIDGVPNIPSGATILQVARYGYASTLLAAQDNKNYLLFSNDAEQMQDFYTHLFSLDIGSPSGAYYIISGTHVYARDFSKAKVLVNPSISSYTVSLGGSYKNLDGQTVSSITMNPHTGEILLRTTPNPPSTSTTTTIPSGFTGNNFVCNYIQTNNLWECSLDYTNNLGEKGLVKFYFIDSVSGEVKSTGSIWTNTGSSGTIGSELSCTNYHGTYNVVWRTYRNSDTAHSNPVAFSTTFNSVTCT